MKKVLLLTTFLLGIGYAGAQCAPADSYSIQGKYTDSSQLQDAELLQSMKERLLQQISSFVDNKTEIETSAENGKYGKKVVRKSRIVSSGFIFNPRVEVCGNMIVMSVDKNLLHSMAAHYMIREADPDALALKQINLNSDQTNRFKLKEQLEDYKAKLDVYTNFLPLVVLSGDQDALDSYESVKVQVGLLDSKVSTFFDDVSEIYNDIKDEDYDTAYEKILQQESAAKDHRSKLKTVRKLKKQLKADAKFAYKTKITENKKLHRSKILLYGDASVSAMSDISGWGGHAQSVLDVGFDYLLSDTATDYSDRNDWLGVGLGARTYLNNSAGVGLGVDLPTGYVPIIFNSDWNEVYGSFMFRVAKINNVGNTFMRFEYGHLLNRFRGKYAVGLTEDKLADFTQYNDYEQLNISSAGVKIFLNSTDHSFVPQFYIGYRILFETQSTKIYNRVTGRATMHSVNVGARIHLRFATKKLTTNRKKLKNEYNY